MHSTIIDPEVTSASSCTNGLTALLGRGGKVGLIQPLAELPPSSLQRVATLGATFAFESQESLHDPVVFVKLQAPNDQVCPVALRIAKPGEEFRTDKERDLLQNST